MLSRVRDKVGIECHPSSDFFVITEATYFSKCFVGRLLSLNARLVMWIATGVVPVYHHTLGFRNLKIRKKGQELKLKKGVVH